MQKWPGRKHGDVGDPRNVGENHGHVGDVGENLGVVGEIIREKFRGDVGGSMKTSNT